MNDFRYALRQLLRQPGFTIMAVVALALGIGANTVLFSAINTLFLRPLSYPQPEQLVRVWGSFPERGLDRANVSWPRFPPGAISSRASLSSPRNRSPDSP